MPGVITARTNASVADVPLAVKYPPRAPENMTRNTTIKVTAKANPTASSATAVPSASSTPPTSDSPT